MADPAVWADPRVAAGIEAIRQREWFEAHELLEEAWREAAPPDKHWLQGLIHGAVALEHLRRGSPRGAWGQLDKATARLADAPEAVAGIAPRQWLAELQAFARAIDLDERSRRQVARAPMDGLPPLPPVEGWPLP